MNLPRLPELTTRDEREVNGVVRRLGRAQSRAELADTFIGEIHRCLPGEMTGWGEMTPDYQQFSGMAISPEYLETTARLVEPISQLLPHHPALQAVGWSGSQACPRRVSDFQSYPSFRDNPLHREAYRHLDANHQVAFSPGVFDGRAVVISLNRKQSDYSDRECQKFHLLGGMVGALLEDLEQRETLQRQLEAIGQMWPLTPAGPARLTPSELRWLSKWADPEASAPAVAGEGERKALYRILDKLELESKNQLLALLHEMRA